MGCGNGINEDCKECSNLINEFQTLMERAELEIYSKTKKETILKEKEITKSKIRDLLRKINEQVTNMNEVYVLQKLNEDFQLSLSEDSKICAEDKN